MSDQPTLQFLGAAGTVTGSMHLVTAGGEKILLDCGEFQGLKSLRDRNWREFPFAASDIACVVLSHAHIDHSGALPLLAKRGFRGPIYTSSGTADLLGPMLRDAAHLQEEDADHANRHGYSKHAPALPLYTTADAEQALKLVQARPYDQPFQIAGGATVLLRRASHILGSATVELQLGTFRLVFTGDLGRYGRPILRDPEPVPAADVLLVESTYGDRVHPADEVDVLARVVKETAARGGALVVPAFAVGRTQELCWMLRDLEDKNQIPVLPVYVDSPMAVDVTKIYARHTEDHNLDMTNLERTGAGRSPLETRKYHLVSSVEESKAINGMRGPIIIISASGMCTGGRVMHHLEQRLPDARNGVLLVGYQAEGTRGRALQDGARTLRFFGQDVPVQAHVDMIHGLSAHADRDEMVRWLKGFTRAPRAVYTVHGEDQAARSLAATITQTFGWKAAAAQDGQTVPLA